MPRDRLLSRSARTFHSSLCRNAFSRDGAAGLKSVVRRDDVPAIRITSDEPVNLQVDGDHLGQRSDVEFVAVPDALRVVV